MNVKLKCLEYAEQWNDKATWIKWMAHDPRYHQEWPEISKYVRLLFNHHCARCGKDCSNPSNSRDLLQVHHIDENPGNNQLENLIPLCSVCHLQIEKRSPVACPHTLTFNMSFLRTVVILRAWQRSGRKRLSVMVKNKKTVFQIWAMRNTNNTSIRKNGRNDKILQSILPFFTAQNP